MNYGLKNTKLSTDYPESNLKRNMTRNEKCSDEHLTQLN